MPDSVSAIGAATSIGGSLLKASLSKKAAKQQVKAIKEGIAEIRGATGRAEEIFAPFLEAASPALRAQMEILGLAAPATDWEGYARSNPELMQAYNAQQTMPSFGAGGFPGIGMVPGAPKQDLAEFAQDWYSKKGGDISQFTTTAEQAQARAIAQQEASPFFQALAEQGQEAILQEASATGGLRGGNVQAALAQFRPNLLNQFITQQYERLGGISRGGLGAGQALASNLLSGASNVAELFTGVGSAKAGGTKAAAGEYANIVGEVGGLLKGAFS